MTVVVHHCNCVARYCFLLPVLLLLDLVVLTLRREKRRPNSENGEGAFTDKFYVRNNTKSFLVSFIYVLGVDISMTDLRKIFFASAID